MSISRRMDKKAVVSSVQFSHTVVSDSLRPHESQHARPPCPAPTSGVHSDSRPSSWWCHPAISSSVVPFSSCPQSLPASESFPMSQLFAWGGQSIGVSASASFPSKESQGWSPSEWIGWTSLQSRKLPIFTVHIWCSNITSSIFLFSSLFWNGHEQSFQSLKVSWLLKYIEVVGISAKYLSVCVTIVKLLLSHFFLIYIFHWSVDLQCFRCTARWCSYANTHMLFLKLFSIIDYYKILTIVPCGI